MNFVILFGGYCLIYAASHPDLRMVCLILYILNSTFHIGYYVTKGPASWKELVSRYYINKSSNSNGLSIVMLLTTLPGYLITELFFQAIPYLPTRRKDDL